jgi:hypothetical protein
VPGSCRHFVFSGFGYTPILGVRLAVTVGKSTAAVLVENHCRADNGTYMRAAAIRIAAKKFS